jgi:hypothetical protein
MPHSYARDLKTRVGLYSTLLNRANEPLIDRESLKGFVVAHLVLLHQITRASVPLMEAALDAASRNDCDGVCARLVPYLRRHISEELYHDAWTLEDLAVVGLTRDEVLECMPRSCVASLVGAQYYWIIHYHPVAILGYIIILETNAPSDRLIDDLRRKSGLPEAAFRSHRVHAALDPGHQQELYETIDALPLSPRLFRLITESVRHTAVCLADCHSFLNK